MARKGLVLGALATALLLGGCGEASSPSPFDQSIQRVDEKYDSDAVADGKFLDAVESAPNTTNRFTSEERIRYGKAVCTLLDNAEEKDRKRLVEDYEGEEQAVSDAAIMAYCPEHL